MSIFGTVVSLPYKPGTIVFIAVLLALMCFEGVLNAAESFCHRNGLHGLIRKLYKEFMILGLISFTIFIISEVYHFDAEDEWYLSFEFAHIVFLFVGINFVLESFLLVALIGGRNKQLLRHDNSSSEKLLLEYLDLQRRGGFMKLLFDYGLVSIPLPELREKIEYKIIQEYFVRSYNLPAEFKFANYLCTLLKTFVFSLLEVRPISWLIIALLAVLNFVRIRVIDPIYQSEVCHKYHTHFHFQPSKHYGEHVCEEYTLRYFFVCSMLLTVYLLCVFAASEVYMQRLIGKVLDEEELLEQLEKEEEMAAMNLGLGHIYTANNRSTSNYSNPAYSSIYNDDKNNTSRVAFNASFTENEAKALQNTQNHSHAGGDMIPTKEFRRADSNTSMGSDLGDCEIEEDFMLEASANMNMNINAGGAYAPLSTGEYSPNTPNTNHAPFFNSEYNIPHISTTAPNTAADTTNTTNNNVGNAVKPSRKVSYGDVNTVSFHIPSTSTDVSPATSPTHASTVANTVANANTNNSTSNNATAAHTNLTNPTHTDTTGHTTSTKSHTSEVSFAFGLTSDDSSGNNSGTNSHNASSSNLLSESLKYDLQSEDGETVLEKRQAAAALALRAVHDRKNHVHVHSAEGAEKQLRRSISEFNVNKDVANRRHLYSLCLQRIMLVEFELLAHQSRKAVGPPLVPKKLEGRKQSVFRRLGSFFAPAAATSAKDSDGGDSGDVSADLELATANSFKNASSQVMSLSRKMSSLHNNNNSSSAAAVSAKTISPQEFISNSLSRRRSAYSMKSNNGNGSGNIAANNESALGFAGATSAKQANTITSTFPAAATDNAANGASTKSGAGLTTRTYSTHFFEMEPTLKRNNSTNRRLRANHMGSMFNMNIQKDSGCSKVLSGFHAVYTFVRSLLTKFWHMLIGFEEELEEPDEDVAIMQDDLRTIFLNESPDMYFFTVEFALLAQCLYIALWATSFIVIAKNSYFPGLWQAALLLPVPFNFWLIQKTIFSACTLKAVVSLDRTVADKICEEALDARNVTERLRKIIRSTLAGLNFEKIKWNGFLHEQFHLFKKDGAQGLSEKEMRLFLHSLQIFLTDTSVARIFTVIDFDRDGRVTWKDLSDIVFPELTQQQLKVNRKSTNISKSTKSIKASKSAKRKSLVGGKSEKSSVSGSPAAAFSHKRATFGNNSDEGSGKGPVSYKPSVAFSGKGGFQGDGVSGKSVASDKSGDFSHNEEKTQSEYTPIKERAHHNITASATSATATQLNPAPRATSQSATAHLQADSTDSDDSAEDEYRQEYLSRYDQEDADFGTAFINHRAINLRNKLTQQRVDKVENEEVFLDDNTDDFWSAGESPKEKKKRTFFG